MKYIDEPWHVKVTEENEAIVGNWLGTTPSVGSIVGMVKWDDKKALEKGWNGPSSIKAGGYDHGVEISFQEFKWNILKQKEEQYYEI